jgi:hypothetical protein
MKMTDKKLKNAIAIIHARGWKVTSPERIPWMTPSELFARYLQGSTKSRMYRRLAGSSAPCVDGRRGESGRLLTLRPTQELIAYLAKPNQGGKRL